MQCFFVTINYIKYHQEIIVPLINIINYLIKLAHKFLFPNHYFLFYQIIHLNFIFLSYYFY